MSNPAESRRPSPAWQHVLLGLYLAALAAYLAVAFDPYRISDDTSQYISTADSLRNGDGLSTYTPYYEWQLTQPIPAPQTTWPPGFPLAIAAAATITRADNAAAVGIVNVASHFLLAMAVYFLTRFAGGGRTAALIAATTTGSYWFLMEATLVGASEVFFALLLVMTSVSILRAQVSGWNWRWCLAAGMALAGASSVRYLAVASIAAMGAAVLWSRRRDSARSIAASLLLVLAPPLLVFAVMFLRNLSLTGVLTGTPGSGSGNDVMVVLKQLPSMFGSITGVSRAMLLPGSLIAVSLLALGVLAKYRRAGAARSGAETFITRESQYLLFAVVLLNFTGALALLIILAVGSSTYMLEGRYLIPYVPLLITAYVVYISGVVSRRDGSGAITAQVFAASCSVTASLCAAWLLFQASRSDHMRDLPNRNSEMLSSLDRCQIDGISARDFIGRRSRSSPVLSNQSQILYGLLRSPTIGVPMERFWNRPWSADDVATLADRFGTSFAAVFPAFPTNAQSRDADFLTATLRTDVRWRMLPSTCQEIEVYELRHAARDAAQVGSADRHQ